MISVTPLLARNRRDLLLVLFLTLASIGLSFLPTGFEDRLPQGAVRAKGRVVEVDNSAVQQFGLVKAGDQDLSVEILDGPFKGQRVNAVNSLMGKMELDKFFSPGDTALVVLNLDRGRISWAAAQDHYRLDLELILLGLFGLLLVAFAGWTGAKALLSFAFAALMIWKIVVPGFLRGLDPIPLGLAVTAALSAAIIFLVGGVNRRGLTACLGALLGLGLTCLLALVFARAFHLHGAVRAFSETLLYSGFPHLNLTRIFLAGVFIASSGAVMDLAMDIAAAMSEVAAKRPDLGRREAVRSGFAVGRAVVGTMTTTLLLAYSGGYVTMLMVFMGQGIPLANVFNLNYVAAEILNTVVGSFGLVTVAPFTALVGGCLLVRRPEAAA